MTIVTETRRRCDVCGEYISENDITRWMRIIRYPWGGETDLCRDCGIRLNRTLKEWAEEYRRDEA